MKKKVLTTLSVVLILGMASMGILALLADQPEKNVNVMTTGNVDITQEEVFEDGAKLYPGSTIGKKVTVTNVGESEAYVRTWFAFETPIDKIAPEGIAFDEPYTTVTINGTQYAIFVEEYGKMAPNEYKESLQSVKMDVTATNDDVDDFDGDYKVLVLSQAVQTENFSDLKSAMDAAFGEATDDNIVKWFGDDKLVRTVTDAEEFHKALTVADVINVKRFNGENNQFRNSGRNVEINGDGEVLVAGATADYGFATIGGSTIYNNVNLDSKGGGIAVTDGAQVEFNGGSVAVNTANTSGRYNFYVVGEGSKVTIEGGTFSFSKTLNQKRAYIYVGAGATAEVNGGTFGPASTRSGYTAGILGTGTVIIKGGTFGFDPSAWVAEGYKAVKSGDTWTVSAE